MKTANATQLKMRINNKTREAGIPPQAIMQNYPIERLLVRKRSGLPKVKLERIRLHGHALTKPRVFFSY